MVERHIIRPSAGRMRPNTSESGIFSTKRRRPVSTSMLTRMLVPKPKNAFQSPGVQIAGRVVAVVVEVIAGSCRYRAQFHKLIHWDCAIAEGKRGEAGRLNPNSWRFMTIRKRDIRLRSGDAKCGNRHSPTQRNSCTRW